MSGQIFISYRREDASSAAGRLYDRLSAQFPHSQIFIDVDNLGPGVDFVEAIETSVASCEVLIAVIGKGWLSSSDEEGRRRLDNPDDWVRLEIATALKRNILVIPVLVDGASMPRRTQLPGDIELSARKNAVEISHDRFRFDSGRLIEAVKGNLEKAAAEQRQREEAEARQREKERLEAEQRERERMEAEQQEKERLKAELREGEAKERLEAQRREKEGQQRLEAERRQKEEEQRLEAEQRERDQSEIIFQRVKARLEAAREWEKKERLEAEKRLSEEQDAEQNRRWVTDQDRTAQAETPPVVEDDGSPMRKLLKLIWVILRKLLKLIWVILFFKRASKGAVVTLVMVLFVGFLWFVSGPKDTYRRAGQADLDAQDYDKAIIDYTQLIWWEPKDAKAYFSRGLAYLDMKDYNRAISDYSMAINLEPGYAEAYYYLALAFKAQGKDAQARDNFKKAKQLGYTGPQ